MTTVSKINLGFTMMEKRLLNGNRIYLSEFLHYVSLHEKEEDKIRLLQAYTKKGMEYYNCIKAFMNLMWNPEIKFTLSEAPKEYRKNTYDYGMANESLFNALKRIRYFIEGSGMIQNPQKRELLFLQQLENMYYEESELLLNILERKLNKNLYQDITKDVFMKAFPEIIMKEEDNG